MTLPADSRRDLWVLLLLVALCGLLFFYRLGAVGLFDVDEAVFAEATREMVTDGDWITPHYNQDNRYDKPIFFYWLMGGSFTLFGISEISARLVSAVLATALTLVLYFFLRHFEWIGARSQLPHPIATPLIFATALEVILLGRAAITDVTLTFFISMALLSFFAGYLAGGSPRTKRSAGGWYRLSYAAMALAVLTKGPVGVVVPGGIIFFFLLATGSFRAFLRESRLFSGILIFLAIASPWYLLEFQANGKEFFDAFFVKHNLTRYTGVNSGHGGPVYYFIPVILLGFFPWIAFLSRPLFRVFSPSAFRAARESERGEHLPLFAGIWFAVVFLFFSLSGTKLPGYILPLFPAMALLVGWEWRGILERRMTAGRPVPGIRTGVWVSAGLGIVMGGGCLALYQLLPTLKVPTAVDPASFAALRVGVGMVGLLFLLGTAVFFLLGLRRKSSAGAGALVGMMAVLVLVLTHQILPAVDKALQTPLRDLAREAGDRVRAEGGKLAVYGMHKPSVIFYSREYAEVFRRGEEEGVSRLLSGGAPVYLIAEERRIEKLPPMEIVARGGGYLLVKGGKGTP